MFCPSCGGVVFCWVCCLRGCLCVSGVRFGALCTNIFFIWCDNASVFYFKKKKQNVLPQKRAEYLSSHLHCCNTRQHRRPVYSNATIPCWPSCWVRIQDGSETPINHVLHLHPAQGLPPHRSTAAPTSACSRHRAPPSSAAASPTAPPERHELRRVQAIPHRHRHRPWRRGRGVQWAAAGRVRCGPARRRYVPLASSTLSDGFVGRCVVYLWPVGFDGFAGISGARSEHWSTAASRSVVRLARRF